MSSPTTPQPADAPTPVNATGEQKVLQIIAGLSSLGANAAQAFGASSVSEAFQTVPTLGLFFAGVLDAVNGILHHHKATKK